MKSFGIKIKPKKEKNKENENNSSILSESNLNNSLNMSLNEKKDKDKENLETSISIIQNQNSNMPNKRNSLIEELMTTDQEKNKEEDLNETIEKIENDDDKLIQIEIKNEWYYKLKSIIRHFFKYNYFFITFFINEVTILTKTNILSIFIFKTIASLSVVAYLSPENSLGTEKISSSVKNLLILG